MTIYFIDLETTVNGGPDADSPEAHWRTNKVLLYGWATSRQNVSISSSPRQLEDQLRASINQFGEVWICAHNAKFDLKWLIREFSDSFPWQYVKVWDTMTWEYRATGHVALYQSLEDTADKYSIKFAKTLNLGELLKQGVKMEDIPKADLTEYLTGDVQVLCDIYLAQTKEGYTPDMDYILPLADMELYGMTVHQGRAQTMGKELAVDTDKLQKKFIQYIMAWCEWQDGSPITNDDFTDLVSPKSKCIKPVANRTISFLLFGQPEELKVTPKWRVQWKYGCAPMYTPGDAREVYGSSTAPSHVGFPMSEDDIHRIEDRCGSKPILDDIIEYRGKSKLLGTYVSPFLYTSSVAGKIHPKLNTTATATGRLSSSQPNGQNMPSEARGLICANDLSNWDMVEVDFKQLEMVGAATLSKCAAMIRAICNGEDLHYNSGRSVMGWTTETDMDDKSRKMVKNVNFGVLYGGKAAGLSKQTKVDKATIQDLIDSFYTQYPGVAVWQKELYQQVVADMYAYDVRNGEQRYASQYTLPISNRRFTFIENEAPDWIRQQTGRGFSFSPQHTANYPIQGFAGGDLVMWALTHLWRSVRAQGLQSHIKFVMTVHDSILLEVRKDVVVMEALVKSMCDATKSHFNLPVPLECDIEAGQFWS